MRVVVQRVAHASVSVDGNPVGAIGPGLMLLVGIGRDDEEKQLAWMAQKLVGLRIFEDDAGKMNLDVRDVGGAVLAISQFTLYGDCSRGRRPGFSEARRPDEALLLFERFVTLLRDQGVPVETGRFGADMKVELLNDGPVTFVVEAP